MLKSICVLFSPPGGTTVSVVLLIVLSSCPDVLSSRGLLVIDVQNCFLGTGQMAVRDGEDIIPVINTIRQNYEQYFSVVVFTQDWHCANHVSFASSHPKHMVYETIMLAYLKTGELCESESTRTNYTVDCSKQVKDTIVLPQKLWPDHCIQHTPDARLHKDLKQEDTDVIIYKGQHCQVDSYSGFFDNGGFKQTDLHETLQKRGIKTVFLVGLAYDYCVFETAKDARKLGYNTYVVLDATGQIDKSSAETATKNMIDLGVVLVNSSDLGSILTSTAPGKHTPHFAALICSIFQAIYHLRN